MYMTVKTSRLWSVYDRLSFRTRLFRRPRLLALGRLPRLVYFDLSVNISGQCHTICWEVEQYQPTFALRRAFEDSRILQLLKVGALEPGMGHGSGIYDDNHVMECVPPITGTTLLRRSNRLNVLKSMQTAGFKPGRTRFRRTGQMGNKIFQLWCSKSQWNVAVHRGIYFNRGWDSRTGYEDSG